MTIKVLKDVPYKETIWEDDIIDPQTGEVLSEGTPYLAKYANNSEHGITSAFKYIIELQKELRRSQIKDELGDRAPANSGKFTDVLDGSESSILGDGAVLITEILAGATTIVVDNTTDLTVFTEVTIYDDENTEDVLITATDGNTLTVQALQFSYKKGARVARSTVGINTTDKEMITAPFVTYSITLVEVV